MPNGRRVTLKWAPRDERAWDIKPAALESGSYSAEVKGDSVWIYVRDLSDEEHKIKYRNVGDGSPDN
jgi:hypothetical protein